MKITKKAKIDPEKHSYPSLLFEDSDEVAFERNVSLMKQEMAKSKPQFGSVTSLMQRTFLRRRQWILDDTQKVEDICLMYPCLSKSIYVSQVRLLCIATWTLKLSLYLLMLLCE